ncbi:hypothetical protein Leryth_004283 [Lithospermum erythrorhizon]|nr:hypothetical protein Leryth_004283 [Lithospermum erythrorhizon]
MNQSKEHDNREHNKDRISHMLFMIYPIIFFRQNIFDIVKTIQLISSEETKKWLNDIFIITIKNNKY